MIAMVNSGRYVQKAIFAFVLVICVIFWKFDSNLSYNKHAILPNIIGTGHHHSAPPKVSRGYSVKPLAYIYPQYYVFDENNRLYGENFTEWVNVLGVNHNRYGLETLRPHESIGYYNGLDFGTRQRQGNFLRDHGFHGAVFHHYWFDDKPVMDQIILAMLKDGEPNVPFMLSWANEPWSKDGEEIMGQKYGHHEAWRKHFDWLLPFFRHPRYIRSEGKVQFAVYHPAHAGHLAPQMFAAWRQWAVEEGLGGLDIIETRWGDTEILDQWEDYAPDAINEFMPLVVGDDPARFLTTRRISRTYHRGSLACWDTTPRHPTDGMAVAEPFCHPKTWQNSLVEQFRLIKEDPNPIGVENFLFVNALNEWGNGNSLEPSIQFGDGFGMAFKTAFEISEREHVWPDIANEDRRIRDQATAQVMKEEPDVCVIVRTNRFDGYDRTFTLPNMLKSLQAQTNQNWRAAVIQTNDTGDFHSLDKIIMRTLDPRIQHHKIPGDVKMFPPWNDEGYMATDWTIKNLTEQDHFCKGAKYLLVTTGNTTYESTAFEDAMKVKADLIALNVESKDSIRQHKNRQSMSWDAHCTSLEINADSLFRTAGPSMEKFDLKATFINTARFLSEGHKFATFSKDFPHQQAAALTSLLINTNQWVWSATASATCQVYHNPSYTSCLKAGNFWLDSPVLEEAGCYRSSEFIKKFESDKPLRGDPQLEQFDLLHFRERGTCVRYREGWYEEAKNRPPPPEKKPPHAAVQFHYSNPDPEDVEKEEKAQARLKYESTAAEKREVAAPTAVPVPEVVAPEVDTNSPELASGSV